MAAPEEAIDTSLRLEYFAAGGSLAVAADDTSLGSRMVDELRTFTMESPFWEAQRNQLLVQLLDFVHRPDALPGPEAPRKDFEDFAIAQ